VIKRDAEKILKYKELTIEIQRTWNVKTKLMPVIIWATGTISNSFRKYVTNIPGKMKSRNCKEQPYWALHTYFGKYLCKNYNRFNTETNDISTMNSNNRTAATLFSLGTYRNISINTVHKGDDYDDYDDDDSNNNNNNNNVIKIMFNFVYRIIRS